jgi:hypothetical protein
MSQQFQYPANDVDPMEAKRPENGDLSKGIIHLFRGQSTKAWTWKGPGMAPDCEGKTLPVVRS